MVAALITRVHYPRGRTSGTIITWVHIHTHPCIIPCANMCCMGADWQRLDRQQSPPWTGPFSGIPSVCLGSHHLIGKLFDHYLPISGPKRTGHMPCSSGRQQHNKGVFRGQPPFGRAGDLHPLAELSKISPFVLCVPIVGCCGVLLQLSSWQFHYDASF